MEEGGPTQVDPTLCKMILNSIEEGDLTKIQANLEKYSIDIKALKDPVKDQNAFFMAALIKDDSQALEIFKYLKSKEVNPGLKDILKQTCLYYTCREGKNLCSKYLVEECGLNANEIDVYGQTPIYYCVRDNKIETVKLMIELGTNINIEDEYGQNCLFYAIRENHFEIVELLIQKGANVNQVDKKKMTPYSFAEKLNLNKICELLLIHGAIKPLSKNEKIIKNKKIKNNKDNNNENNKEQKIEMSIEEIQKPKKFLLIKITEDGKKIPLNENELNQFQKDYSKIYDLLEKEDERKKAISNVNHDLLFYDNWEKQAKKLMNSLWKIKESELFHKPVDPIELGIPDYFTVIKKPMDFSTIKRKLNSLIYTNFKEFVEDIELTFKNCYLYNGERTPVGLMCSVVKNEYNKLFNQLGMEKFL
jgi:ankyrin repeat protein